MSSPQRMAQCGSTRPDYHLCLRQCESLHGRNCGPEEPHLMPPCLGPLFRRKVPVSMNLFDQSPTVYMVVSFGMSPEIYVSSTN